MRVGEIQIVQENNSTRPRLGVRVRRGRGLGLFISDLSGVFRLSETIEAPFSPCGKDLKKPKAIDKGQAGWG
jgi:hypothetical protein